MLMSRLAPQTGAQYGAFVDAPGIPDWSTVARDCEALLSRTRDIVVLVGWCRARLALAQAPGLAQALRLMRSVLERWPNDVHPQLTLDGVPDPAVRANAVAALADPDGLPSEVGDLVVSAITGLRLTVRDVQRAPAAQRAAQVSGACGATSPQVVSQVSALRECAAHVRAIDAWARGQLGDDAPSLSRLLLLLTPFELAEQYAQKTRTQEMPRAIAKPASEIPGLAQRARHDAAAYIRSAREWFETHEPSSPVAVLLKQAERMVGQRFVQVADAIPLDLLRQWDAHGPDAEA